MDGFQPQVGARLTGRGWSTESPEGEREKKGGGVDAKELAGPANVSPPLCYLGEPWP